MVMAGPTGKVGTKIPSGYKQSQIQTYTPEMMQLLESLYPHVGEDSYLSKLAGGDESAFAEMEAPAMRQFQQLQGDTATRFSNMGMGARGGSGFQNQMTQATSDFAQDLASKRMETRMKALEDLIKFSDAILGKNPYETGPSKKNSSSGGWGGAIGAAGGGALGFFATGGNPAGAMAGANIGYKAGSGF